MTPYRNTGSDAWKARVRHPDGRSMVAGCDTTKRATANAMERWALDLYNDRTPTALAVLDAILRKRVTLPRAYDQRGRLAELVASFADENIEPHVARWHAAKRRAKKGAASADKYLVQVRAFIPPKTPFPLSRFTSKEIRRHLRALTVEDPTRNRHKAALSSFADFLVDEDVLERNVVRDVKGWAEGEGRVVHYERDQAQALIAALSQPFQAIEALMVGAGFEWQAVSRLRVRDVDLATGEVTAHGGKTHWRNRRCRIVEAWAIPYIRPALAGKFDNQVVFEGLTEYAALASHKAAVRALGLPESTLHDWRHTHAVLMLRSGYKPTVVAHQLGHRDTSLVWKRYGRFVVDSRDYILPAVLPDTKENIK
jgi:integrase